MQKEIISSRHAVCIIVLFVFGSSVILGVNADVGQDSWIPLIFALVISIPVIMIYARIIKLFPEKDIFEVSIELFGKIGGKITIALLTWYAIHLAAMVLRNFSEFIDLVAMPETPQTPIMIAMILTTIYIAKSGVTVLGKWSMIALPIVLLTFLMITLFSLSNMDFTNILPIMNHSVDKIAASSFKLLTFPFGETILFLGLSSSLKKNVSPYKVYLYGVLIGGFILLITILRNLMCSSSAMVEAEYFPSYMAARLINIGSFITRIEGSVSINFILSGITKITVCLIVASKGIAYLFNIPNYKKMIVPVGLIILALCASLYSNIMEMFNFITVYSFYAIPFQFAIPIVIWLAAEFKKRRTSNLPIKNSSPNIENGI